MPQRVIDLGSSSHFVVASDLHLRSLDDERTRLFCQFLDQLPSCDTLVLLGDVFDFINARQTFYYRRWSAVFDRLKSLRQKGVKVVFVEGNHDYGFEHHPCLEVKECFDFCGDFIGLIEHKKMGSVALLHSDDVVCPPSYRLFRNVVKSGVFQGLMSPIPGSATSALFAKYAEISRSKDHYRKLSDDFLTACVDDFIQTRLNDSLNNPQICVFGHIHVALDDLRNNIRFVSGPDWFSAPSVMSFTEDGQFKRTWFCPPDAIPEPFLFSNVRNSSGFVQS
jgi:UDP-2,3-diacylglucosamine hydrolase